MRKIKKGDIVVIEDCCNCAVMPLNKAKPIKPLSHQNPEKYNNKEYTVLATDGVFPSNFPNMDKNDLMLLRDDNYLVFAGSYSVTVISCVCCCHDMLIMPGDIVGVTDGSYSLVFDENKKEFSGKNANGRKLGGDYRFIVDCDNCELPCYEGVDGFFNDTIISEISGPGRTVFINKEFLRLKSRVCKKCETVIKF